MKILWVGAPTQLSGRLGERFELVHSDTPRIDRLRGDKPDLTFLSNPGLSTDYTGWDEIDTPCVSHFIDSHFLFTWQSEMALLFDAIVLEVIGTVPYFWRNGHSSVAWCPPYYSGPAEEVREHPPSADRPYDVCFVGSLNPGAQPYRVRFFQRLSEKLKGRHIFFIGKTPKQVGDYYSRAKIVINYSSRPLWCYYPNPLFPRQHVMGLNGRVFEAMGHGALLLSDLPNDDLVRLFREGTHFVGYQCHNDDEAMDKIEYYLEHRDERLAIAHAGWKLVGGHHTFDIRAKELVHMVEAIAAKGRTSQMLPMDKAFFLGRALIRMALHTLDPPRNYGQLLKSARKCLLKALQGRYREASNAWVGFVDLIEGKEKLAVDRWSDSFEEEKSVIATYFLESLFRKHGQHELADRIADWRNQQPPHRQVHLYEELVLRDILTRVLGYQPRVNQPRGPDEYLRLARRLSRFSFPDLPLFFGPVFAS